MVGVVYSICLVLYFNVIWKFFIRSHYLHLNKVFFHKVWVIFVVRALFVLSTNLLIIMKEFFYLTYSYWFDYGSRFPHRGWSRPQYTQKLRWPQGRQRGVLLCCARCKGELSLYFHCRLECRGQKWFHSLYGH